MSRRSLKYKERHSFEEDESEIEVSKQGKKALSAIPATSKHALPSNDILRLFQQSFKYLFDSPNLELFVQTVKGDLFNRDYMKAFGDDDRRMAYCVRWTPSRALAYSSLLASLDETREIICGDETNILVIGGGACGELAAMSSIYTQSQSLKGTNEPRSHVNINLIDIADWTRIVGKMVSEIRKNWTYQDPEAFNVNFSHDDVLSMDPSSLNLGSLDLITTMFTTNELFAEDKARSLRFFQLLNKECQSGCYLIITESAGSYSHIEIGTKKFPIQFLIDTILLGKDQKSGDWELIKQSDSCWYRCDKDFEYPLKLENMRFFFRLYRKK
jgi:25S rRNA (uracil2843-N3)-methyltransferase